jgi:hypothetical protein
MVIAIPKLVIVSDRDVIVRIMSLIHRDRDMCRTSVKL